MPKSVLGNDPFQTASEPEAKPVRKSTAKKSAGTKKKTAAKPASKEAAEKTAPEKPAAKKTAPKKASVKKATAKKAAAKKPAAKKAPGGGIEGKQASPGAAVPKKAKRAESPAPETSASGPEIRKVSKKTSRTLRAILHSLRPDGFSIGQEFGFDPGLRERLEPLLRFFYRFYWRVQVVGAENIPKEGRAVLVANHAGILPFDGLMLANAIFRETGRTSWPLVEDFFYYAPVLGTLLSRIGFVRACQENAQRLLADDELAIVFPEGIKGIVKPYRNRYRLQRFGRGGFVKLALVSDAPVIPVAIVGSEEAHPILSNSSTLAKALDLPFFPVTPLFPLLGPFGLWPLPSKWTIRIGEPVAINEEYGPEAGHERVTVNRLSARIKADIQKEIDLELGQRRSRWR